MARGGVQVLAVIDVELRSFIEADRAIVVASRNKDLVPHSQRAWGPRVSEDGRSIELFVDRPAATTTVANLRDNGRIAVCLTQIDTNRSVQLKGRCVEVGDPEADDWSAIEEHRQGFTRATAMLGFPADMIRNLWSTQVVKLRFVVDDIYDQTPGPKAGKPL
jgi:hypothetical protein